MRFDRLTLSEDEWTALVQAYDAYMRRTNATRWYQLVRYHVGDSTQGKREIIDAIDLWRLR